MTRVNSILLGGILILSSCGSGLASAECLDRPEIKLLTRSYTGRYLNEAYGFSVEIPQSLVGRDVDNPLYQRGFTIVFEDPEESLRVYADVNSVGWDSVQKAAIGYAHAFRKDVDKILSTSSEDSVLGGRRAVTIKTQFLCQSSSTHYASVLIVTLSRDNRFIYALRWEGKLEEENAGRQMLKSLCSSWHFHKPTA